MKNGGRFRMIKYCRGCNEDIKVIRETEKYFIDERGFRHPKVDCDNV